MFLDLGPEQWLGFTVLAAIISLIGTVIGIILKDYLFSRAFENWKQRKALDKLYQKFRDPLLLSAEDLCTRLIEILDNYPTYYLKQSVLDSHPDKPILNNTDDPYFQRYKLVSTVYRLSSFLAWLELSRQEIVFLNSGNNTHWEKLKNTLAKIMRDLADGDLNKAENWSEWKDMLIFREEIRAIGEAMLEPYGNSKAVIGYSKFCELFDSIDTHIIHRWIQVVLNFFLDLKDNLDFRKYRLIELSVHLIELIELLETTKLEKRFINARMKLSSAASSYPLSP